MKKNKLLSIFTALALTLTSSISLISNAFAVNTNYTQIGTNVTREDIIKNIFGEDTIVLDELASSGFYFVMSPEKFGTISISQPKIVVKLKTSSELTEINLTEAIWANCTKGAGVVKSSDWSKNNKEYILSKNSVYSGDIYQFIEEVYPSIVEFLSTYDDVVSVYVKNPAAVCYTNTIGHSILVSNEVDFDYDKYSDYEITDNYWDTGKLSIIPKFVSTEKFYEDMYNTYLSLKSDYGEENIDVSYIVLESIEETEEKSVSSNVYTAAITGDVITDGEVSIADAVGIMAYVSNPENNSLNEQQIANGDIHEPGNGLNANDALKLQQYLAGITEL